MSEEEKAYIRHKLGRLEEIKAYAEDSLKEAKKEYMHALDNNEEITEYSAEEWRDLVCDIRERIAENAASYRAYDVACDVLKGILVNAEKVGN